MKLGKKRNIFFSLILVLTAISVIWFLQNTQRRTSPAIDAAEPVILFDSLPSVVSSLDPAQIKDIYSYHVGRQIFEGLVRLEAAENVSPSLAEQWEINGRIITFFLRQRVFFFNPQSVDSKIAFTADDVVASLHHSVAPGGTGRIFFGDSIEGAKAYMEGRTESISGVKVIDQHTVQISCLIDPKLLLFQLASPAGYISPVDQLKSNDQLLFQKPVGTGPFYLAEWHTESQLILKRNPNYWGRIDGNLNQVQIAIIKDPTIRFMEFRKKRLDLVDIPASKMEEVLGEDVSLLQPFEKTAKVYSVGTNQTEFVGFINKKSIFQKNNKLKQAMNFAVNRQSLVKNILNNQGLPQGRYLPMALIAGNDPKEGIDETFFYNLEYAKNLLADAGYPGGEGLPELSLLVTSGSPWEEIGIAIQDMLQKIGIRIQIEVVPFSLLFGQIGEGKTDMFLFSFAAPYPSPHSLLTLLISNKTPPNGFNFLYYQNEQYDRLVSEYGQTPTPSLLADINKELYSDPPMLYLYSPREYKLVSNNIEHFRYNSIPSYSYAPLIKK